MKNIEVYFMWLFIYSVCGWVIESLLFSLKEHKFVNRGLLKGPYCLIYGVGALTAVSLSENMFIGAVIGTIVMCVLKLVLSALTKKYGKEDKLSLPVTIIWALISSLIINMAHPAVASFTNSIHHALLRLIFVLLIALLLVDMTASFYILSKNNEADNK